MLLVPNCIFGLHMGLFCQLYIMQYYEIEFWSIIDEIRITEYRSPNPHRNNIVYQYFSDLYWCHRVKSNAINAATVQRNIATSFPANVKQKTTIWITVNEITNCQQTLTYLTFFNINLTFLVLHCSLQCCM